MGMTKEEKIKARKERDRKRQLMRQRRNDQRKFSHKDTKFDKLIKSLYWRIEDGIFFKQLSLAREKDPNLLRVTVTFLLTMFWIMSVGTAIYCAFIGAYEWNIFGAFSMSVGVRDSFFLSFLLEFLFLSSATFILYPTLITFLYLSNKNV